MRGSMNMKSLMLSVVAALLLSLAIPAATLAQGKGHGKGHGKGGWSDRIDHNRSGNRRNRRAKNYDKKCGKFVNCHDARAGRIDGRGPNGSRVSNAILRSRRNRDRNSIWRNRARRTVPRVIVNP